MLRKSESGIKARRDTATVSLGTRSIHPQRSAQTERVMLADSGDRSRGVMKHEEEVLEKNGNYPTEQGDAPGKTKSRPLRRVTGQRWKTRPRRAGIHGEQNIYSVFTYSEDKVWLPLNSPNSKDQHSCVYSMKST